MAGKREDAWKLGAGWNDTFLWYAKAIIELKKRDIIDRTSWRYLAAMHQFDRDLWIQLGIIDESTALPPAADTAVTPTTAPATKPTSTPMRRGLSAVDGEPASAPAGGWPLVLAESATGLQRYRGIPTSWKILNAPIRLRSRVLHRRSLSVCSHVKVSTLTARVRTHLGPQRDSTMRVDRATPTN